jgi:3-deoxy-D-manno-octulosonate 8-phosphate phosphatase (KDO 8-P phosphatase)
MVKLIVYDFDGVLTDNRVLVHQDGTEAVFCNRSDGWWMKELRKLGIDQVILSTETNPVVAARARKLQLQAHQGLDDKAAGLRKLLAEKELDPAHVAYVGNDMNDYECLRMVGYPLCPSDSHPEVLRAAKLVIPCRGGEGIARHVYDWVKSL